MAAHHLRLADLDARPAAKRLKIALQGDEHVVGRRSHRRIQLVVQASARRRGQTRNQDQRAHHAPFYWGSSGMPSRSAAATILDTSEFGSSGLASVDSPVSIRCRRDDVGPHLVSVGIPTTGVLPSTVGPARPVAARSKVLTGRDSRRAGPGTPAHPPVRVGGG